MQFQVNQVIVPNWSFHPSSYPLWGDLPLFFGKGGSIVGMTSVGRSLFVHGSHRNKAVLTPNTADTPKFDAWNGLTFVPDAGTRPALITPQEGWSAGPGLGTDLATAPYRAVPEGSDIAYTASGDRWYVAANYCGDDWAGHLLVLWLPNLSSVDFTQRMVIPLYELLADWVDGVAPWNYWTKAPTTSPFGPEMPRGYYTCTSTPTGPSCPSGDPGQTIGGNKLRPILYVTIPQTAPLNAGKRFLVAGLNLDPIDIDTYEDVAPVELDGGALYDRDDGKYDYVVFMDITVMRPDLNPPYPYSAWQYQNLAAWKEHTTFVRLPPDLPAGWSINTPATNPPLQPGHDWSYVEVLDPSSPPGPSSLQRIVGSGTPKSIARHPNGRYLYILASDQGQESVQENETLTDGGWHVPHLYVLDLFAVDLTNQSDLNVAMDEAAPVKIVTQRHRFNKLVSAEFGATPNYGSTLVNSTMNMPKSQTGPTSKSLIGGAACQDVGQYYPGEYQTDPTARTRMLAIGNPNFTQAERPNRLYVGTTGRVQSTVPSSLGSSLGAVHVFWLADDGTPTWLRTLTIEQGLQPSQKYQVAGIDSVPTAWLAAPTKRNVIAVTAGNTTFSDPAIDRLALLQDGPAPP